MGSPTLRVGRLALYLAWTLPPDAGAGGGPGLAPPWTVTLPRFYHRWCCRILGFGCARSAADAASARCCSPPITSPMLDITVLGSLIPGSFIAKSRGRRLAAFRLARQAAAHGLCRPPGAQHRAAARRDRRAARRRRRADPVSRRHQRRRQSRAAVQERVVQRRSTATSATAPVAVQPVSIAYTRLDGMPIGRLYRPFFAWYGDDRSGAASVEHARSRHRRGRGRVSPADVSRRFCVAQGARRILPCADRRRARRRPCRPAAADAEPPPAAASPIAGAAAR